MGMCFQRHRCLRLYEASWPRQTLPFLYRGSSRNHNAQLSKSRSHSKTYRLQTCPEISQRILLYAGLLHSSYQSMPESEYKPYVVVDNYGVGCPVLASGGPMAFAGDFAIKHACSPC